MSWSDFEELLELLCIIFISTAVVLLVGGVIALPISRLSINADIEKFKASKALVEEMRACGELNERTAAILDIAEQNRWLVSLQYWNGTVFDWWVPDAVDELEPIRSN